MRINTRTDKIELLKSETAALTKAMTLCGTIGKHGDGRIEEFAHDAATHLGGLLTALAEQGQEEAVAPPY